MMTAIGGITSATAEITTAAVTEYSLTTVHARMTETTQTPIKMKYRRSRTFISYPVTSLQAAVTDRVYCLRPHSVPQHPQALRLGVAYVAPGVDAATRGEQGLAATQHRPT
jgi:hypothetical protein